jgi:polyisoprenoid-binding protein YceI
MRRNLLGLSLAVALLMAPAALAQKRAYDFDKSHSQINFVADARLFSAHGFFGAFEGDIQLDPKDWGASTLSITIDAASINTRNDRRDNHLRSADFFDAANHPKITFTSTKITKVDDKNISIAGDMTIRGNTKPVVVPLQVVFWGDADGRFKGTFNISRKEFGIMYNSAANPIEDMIVVQFDFHLVDRLAMEQRRQQRQQAPAKQPQ